MNKALVVLTFSILCLTSKGQDSIIYKPVFLSYCDSAKHNGFGEANFIFSSCYLIDGQGNKYSAQGNSIFPYFKVPKNNIYMLSCERITDHFMPLISGFSSLTDEDTITDTIYGKTEYLLDNSEILGDETLEYYHDCDKPYQDSVTAYYPNGAKKLIGFFKDGKPHGSLTTYYITGEVKTTGTYNKGIRNGTIKKYYPGGGLFSTGTYRDGILIDTFYKYYPNGSLLRAEFNYANGQEYFIYYDDMNNLMMLKRQYIADSMNVPINDFAFYDSVIRQNPPFKNYIFTPVYETFKYHKPGVLEKYTLTDSVYKVIHLFPSTDTIYHQDSYFLSYNPAHTIISQNNTSRYSGKLRVKQPWLWLKPENEE